MFELDWKKLLFDILKYALTAAAGAVAGSFATGCYSVSF